MTFSAALSIFYVTNYVNMASRALFRFDFFANNNNYNIYKALIT